MGGVHGSGVELTPLGATTRLVLEHGGIAVEGTATGLGAGWHAHLTALRDVLDGRDAVADRWWPLYESLRPEYEELVRAL